MTRPSLDPATAEVRRAVRGSIGGLRAGSIVVVYFTPMLNFILKYHVGHEFMIVHFLMTGYIFSLVLIGIDPIPYRPIYPIRLILLLATLGYHAFVGIAMMNMT